MAIPVSELRIGNWVEYYDGRQIQVTPELIVAQYHAITASKPFTWIEPIPLTEDVLLKCGFEDAGVRNSKDLNTPIKWSMLGSYTTIEKNNNDFEYVLSTDEWGDSQKSVDIKYLHQLQNLYFLLTGEELTYTP